MTIRIIHRHRVACARMQGYSAPLSGNHAAQQNSGHGRQSGMAGRCPWGIGLCHAAQQGLRLLGFIACLAMGSTQLSAVLLNQGTTGQFGNDLTAPISITNNDSGVTYNSLKFDSQLADLLWSAYGVTDLYNNDFSSFVNSGTFGYDIDSVLSQVKNGWNSNVNSDGTISLTNVGGPSDQFNTGKTMTGNYFFNKSLLDADNDGNPNYTFHLLSDAEGMPNFSSPLTKTGIVGSGLDSGHFLEAYFGIDTFSAPGQAYALVPTDFHPQIPEPRFFAVILSLFALSLGLRKRRMKA